MICMRKAFVMDDGGPYCWIHFRIHHHALMEHFISSARYTVQCCRADPRRNGPAVFHFTGFLTLLRFSPGGLTSVTEHGKPVLIKFVTGWILHLHLTSKIQYCTIGLIRVEVTPNELGGVFIRSNR